MNKAKNVTLHTVLSIQIIISIYSESLTISALGLKLLHPLLTHKLPRTTSTSEDSCYTENYSPLYIKFINKCIGCVRISFEEQSYDS